MITFRLNKTDLFYILLVLVATYIAWHGVLNQMIEGEGFIYFSHGYQLKEVSFFQFDNFARIFTYFWGRLFGPEMAAYMTAIYVGINMINVSIYFLLKSLTRNSHIALITVLLFGTGFQGSFQLYARGHWQWFTQRSPEIIPFIFSLIFVKKYFNTKEKKYYFFSFLFYALTLEVSNYAIFLSPLIISYFFLNEFATNIKNLLKPVLLITPFVLFNYFLISHSSLTGEVISSGNSLIQFIASSRDFAQKVLFQLTVITVPTQLLYSMSERAKKPIVDTILYFGLPTLIFYLYAIYYAFYKKLDYSIFVLSVFVGLLTALFLNAYVNRVASIYGEINEGRYYYIPSIYVSIIISIFFINITKGHATLRKIFYLVVIFLVVLNIQNINTKIDHSQYTFTGGRLVLSKLATNKAKFDDKAIVVLPGPLMPSGVDFLKKYYGMENTTFLFIGSHWQDVIPKDFDLKNLYVFNYNDEFKSGGRADLEKIKVLDESEKYRDLLSIERGK